MIHPLKASLAAMVLSLLACLASTAQAQTLSVDDSPAAMHKLVEDAKKEGSLLYYTTTPQEYLAPLIGPFEQKYGIKVNVWRSRSEMVLERVMNESRAGSNSADVVEMIGPPMEALSREGALMAVTAPNQKDLAPGAVPKHRQWTSTLKYVLAQAYNTHKVKKSDLPKSYADLLAPKWKGQLAIEGDDHEWVSAVISDMGEAEGLRFFKQLFTDNQVSVRAGHPVLTNLVVSGEIPIALTVYQYSVELAKAKGAPIDWFAIEPAICIPDAMGIPKKAQHPNAALLFYNYILGEEGQRALAKIGYYPSSTKVEAPIKGVKLKILDPSQLLDNQQKSYDRYQAIQKQAQL
jgi:iron(III) transport system substrate-binding protein